MFYFKTTNQIFFTNIEIINSNIPIIYCNVLTRFILNNTQIKI